jgi:hypothetical protein
VAMQLGADQLPSGNRATTSPDPALPENTKPALRMVNTARPIISHDNVKLASGFLQNGLGDRIERSLWVRWIGYGQRITCMDLPRNDLRILAALALSPGSEKPCIRP